MKKDGWAVYYRPPNGHWKRLQPLVCVKKKDAEDIIKDLKTKGIYKDTKWIHEAEFKVEKANCL